MPKQLTKRQAAAIVRFGQAMREQPKPADRLSDDRKGHIAELLSAFGVASCCETVSNLLMRIKQ